MATLAAVWPGEAGRRLLLDGCLVLAHLATLVVLCTAADEVDSPALYAAVLVCAAYEYAMTLRAALHAVDNYRNA